MNELHIYNNQWFRVSEWGFVEDAPCKQVIDFRDFSTMEKALEKLKELWKDYRVVDHRDTYEMLLKRAREYTD